jgi:hypothetical protein
VTVPVANLSLPEVEAELDRIEAADPKHLKARQRALQTELNERMLAEAAARIEALAALKRTQAELEPLLAPHEAALRDYVAAASALSDARERYTLAFQRARALGCETPPLIPRFSVRAARDPELRKLLYKLQAIVASDS